MPSCKIVSDVGSAACKRTLEVNALVMVVRHMGNGVDRVENAVLTPLGDILPERDLPGRHPLSMLSDERLVDLVRAGMRSLSMTAECTEYVADGFARALTDDQMLIAVWLLSSS